MIERRELLFAVLVAALGYLSSTRHFIFWLNSLGPFFGLLVFYVLVGVVLSAVYRVLSVKVGGLSLNGGVGQGGGERDDPVLFLHSVGFRAELFD